ncbi:sensor histidine kinase [Anaerocolumna aminovalerica]|uniref:ATP-binding protein n=1 Tax=Anaerocolumna aminovalerica TaxID=1527 RepID=UPI001C0E9652|nr:sensor histidine kinase [Anaerocolumna aminovalerica]MBU5334528.1 sensor histidine kinase [Anaerocolumna aminovalerica]
MMTEISLNVLDVAQNSIEAGASHIIIDIKADHKEDYLKIVISDDGYGMTDSQLAKVDDPFYTTRTTRAIGLGVPFFKYGAEMTGGTFTIVSEAGKGTEVTAAFVLSHIDRMPLGDITSTMVSLITCNENIHFIYSYSVDGRCFTLDTKEFREILGDISFQEPEVSNFIKEYLQDHKDEVDQGEYI